LGPGGVRVRWDVWRRIAVADVVNSLIGAGGIGLLFVSRPIANRYQRRLQGSEAVVAEVVSKETMWTDGGGKHLVYVGDAEGGIEVDRKMFDSTRVGDEVHLFRHPRSGELVHLSADQPFAFLILILGWLITGLGAVLAAVNLIEFLAE
jgi:hypothetical protein